MVSPTMSDEYKLEEVADTTEWNVNITRYCVVSRYFDTDFEKHANLKTNEYEKNNCTIKQLKKEKRKFCNIIKTECCIESNTETEILLMPEVVDQTTPENHNDTQDSGYHNESQDSHISQENHNQSQEMLYDLEDHANNESDKIMVTPFYNITPRVMPESPHHIIEEQFKSNPWVMLVATIFLTKTSGRVARPFMKKFLDHFPSPLDVLNADPAHLETYFETLGLKKRGSMIWKMSFQFISGKWRRASDLYGVGKYGEDAYRIFCLGHFDVEPTDRYLRLYLDWLMHETDHVETCSIAESENLIVDPVDNYYKMSLR